MELKIYNPTLEDLPEIMRVEESWPESGRAPEDKFIARIQKFSQGFFVGESEGRLVATVTACPVTYDPDDMDRFSNWKDVTNDGYLYDIGDLSDYNAIYVVSGVIDKDVRGADVFAPMMTKEIELAAKLGYGYVCAGAVLPGYADYCEKHGQIEPEDYVFTKIGQHWVDPLLEMYRKLDFSVPDRNHVKRDYYPDEASLNCAAMVVRRV